MNNDTNQILNTMEFTFNKSMKAEVLINTLIEKGAIDATLFKKVSDIPGKYKLILTIKK